MKPTITLLWFASMFSCILSMPFQKSEDRKGKSLTYFDYTQPDEPEYQNYIPENEQYSDLDYEENELSRTIPKRKTLPSKPYNSPIYYIRLPPQPYIYVPGLGYVSQQSQSVASQFLNLPVNFISNGKPGTIYQWSGAMGNFPAATQPLHPVPPLTSMVPSVPKRRPVRPKPTDSTIHRLPGKYEFNGKPNDIFVLPDSYNSIYGDALQNFYP